MNKADCPSCRGPMFRQSFAHRTHGVVELDICFACQGIWFDQWESPQIAPGGIIDLFRLIHAHRDDPRQTLRDTLNCPHCQNQLLHARDRVKSGPFNYYRCLERHGRFTAFAQFMIEKGFVRQLNGSEIKQLQARLGTVSCSSCGAPLDIRHDTACSHCRSPITILDPDAVEKALANYSQAEVKRAEPDRAAQLDALAEVIMASDKLESTLRRTGKGPGLARPSATHIDNETDLLSRLFGD